MQRYGNVTNEDIGISPINAWICMATGSQATYNVLQLRLGSILLYNFLLYNFKVMLSMMIDVPVEGTVG